MKKEILIRVSWDEIPKGREVYFIGIKEGMPKVTTNRAVAAHYPNEDEASEAAKTVRSYRPTWNVHVEVTAKSNDKKKK